MSSKKVNSIEKLKNEFHKCLCLLCSSAPFHIIPSERECESESPICRSLPFFLYGVWNITHNRGLWTLGLCCVSNFHVISVWVWKKMFRIRHRKKTTLDFLLLYLSNAVQLSNDIWIFSQFMQKVRKIKRNRIEMRSVENIH